MKLNIVAYLTIIVLIIIVLLQNKSCKRDDNTIKADTVIVVEYDTIREIIPGKPVFINQTMDTSIWMKKAEYKPDTTYKGLLNQYTNLGIKHFSTNVFKSDFKIADYGSVTITDSVSGNWLLSSTLETNLTIPTTTITIEKEAPPKNRFYIGAEITGNKENFVNGIYIGTLFKTKKEKMYGIGIGYTGEINYKGSLYWPLKFN